MGKIVYDEFYQAIRSYFSSLVVQYDNFKNQRTVEEKIQFLLKNDVVQTQLRLLQERNNAECPRRSKPENGQTVTPKKEPKTFSVLKDPKSSNFPQLSKKVELKTSKKKGRMLVAKEKINIGDVIIVEKAAAFFIHRKYFDSHCSRCLQRLHPFSTFPCQHCEVAKYCSETCLQENEAEFHWAECGFEELQEESIGKMAMLVYRLLVKTGLETCINVATVKELGTVVYDSADYKASYAQVDHESKRDPGDTFRRSMIALYLAHYLRQSGFFGADTSDNFFSADNRNLVIICRLLVRHLQSCSCNAYEVSELVRTGKTGPGDDNLELGGAIYPTISLSNHSCSPNTIRNSEGTKCVLRAIATIYPGQEVLDNYGYYFQTKERASRQQDLSAVYYFVCDCTACSRDWPLYHDLRKEKTVYVCDGCKKPVKNPGKDKKCSQCKKELKLNKLLRKMATFTEDVRKTLDKMSVETLPNILDHFNELLREMETKVQHPCADYLLCQQVVSHCYALKGNNAVLK